MPIYSYQKEIEGPGRYYAGVPRTSGKNWYAKWVKQFGGRGRYGGGREAYDLALKFGKGEGSQYSNTIAQTTTPMMTAAYNAGKDYMRATGQRESSSGGNAQAGLLATLAAGRAGLNSQTAIDSRLNQLLGLAGEERGRTALEIDEETDYRNYALNRAQSMYGQYLQKRGLGNQQFNTMMQAAVSNQNANIAENAGSPWSMGNAPPVGPMELMSDYEPGPPGYMDLPEVTPTESSLPQVPSFRDVALQRFIDNQPKGFTSPADYTMGVANAARQTMQPKGGQAEQGSVPEAKKTAQNAATANLGLDPFAPFKSMLRGQKLMNPLSTRGRAY